MLNTLMNPCWLLALASFSSLQRESIETDSGEQFLDTGVVTVVILKVDCNDLSNYLKLVSACSLAIY